MPTAYTGVAFAVWKGRMGAPEYAFPHGAADEDRRLELFEQRLDPLTIRRLDRLGVAEGSRCLEVAGGRGSIAQWLCGRVGPSGHVTATDVQTDFLARLALPNLTAELVARLDHRISWAAGSPTSGPGGADRRRAAEAFTRIA